MTREEQRYLRELKKPFELACRQVGRTWGWRSIAGTRYQVRDGMLYELYLYLPPVGVGRRASAWLNCKPLALDDLFWEIFHMREEAEKMPFSFHVNGAFTAHVLTLDRWSVELLPEALEAAVNHLFAEAEKKIAARPFPDISSFRQAAAGIRGQELNVVLCLLLEGRYHEAAGTIDDALAQGRDGGYLRMSGGSILEDAREWCAIRLAEQAT